MKFVIWGMGVRGKRAAGFVGFNNVMAFVDSDKSLIGTSYRGIPVVRPESLSMLYRDCLLIISPVNHESIIKMLEDIGIETYFVFNECPSAILHGKIEELHEISFPEFNFDRTAIHGASLYSILLWEKFLKEGYDIPLVVNKNSNVYKTIANAISGRVYFEEEASGMPFDMIMQTMKYEPALQGKNVIDLYHIDEYADKFYHPELQKFKDIGKGKRCFIVGNGSSITIADLNKLYKCNEVCFGMNGIPLIFKDTRWRPHYYVCEDAKAMEVFGSLIAGSEMSDIFLSDVNSAFLDKVKKMHNVNVFHMAIEDYFPDFPEFSADIERSIYNGRTVTYVCIQIAVYMGFREIYLLGIDFDYADGDTTQVKHFTKDYHLGSEKINPCRRAENLLAYEAARKYADAHEVKIYNATRGGSLEVFERVEFDDLF